MPTIHSRRRFLAGLSAAGAASLIGAPTPSLAEPPPETTTVRLPQWKGSGYCWAASYIAGEMLRGEGFTDVRYVQGDPNVDQSIWIAQGLTDFSINYPPMHITQIESGIPIKVLSGLHSGCLELIASERVRSVADLKGKRVGITGFGNASHVHMQLMTAYVGLDPATDIEWIDAWASPSELLAQGKIDAALMTPPRTFQIRAQKFGHAILNSAIDPPWSQYFCCMVSATSEYADKYPVATKRVLRAMLKAADLCVSNPQIVAQELVDRGFLPSYEYARATLNEVRYDRWREFDPEDSLRFYTLRMQETGLIRSSPQKIIADGADWRFLNELKRELKT